MSVDSPGASTVGPWSISRKSVLTKLQSKFTSMASSFVIVSVVAFGSIPFSCTKHAPKEKLVHEKASFGLWPAPVRLRRYLRPFSICSATR